jgi:ATP-dependent Clp protease ATP-binding subunit ClpA
MPFINDQLAENQVRLASQTDTCLFSAACMPDKTVAARRQSRFRFEPSAVMSLLRSRIIAQDAALAAIEDMLNVVKADIGSKQRPLCVMLLLGPTGVGKTQTARLIAEAICGSVESLVRIDMNTLAQDHYAAALTGAPPGYVGSKEGHSLFPTEAIAGSYSVPSVILFDEIEKASDEVIRSLLNVLDSGKLKLSSGLKELDFCNSLIFMSSNIAASELERHRNKKYVFTGRKISEKKLIDRALGKKFDPEFINRIDASLVFKHLRRSDLGALFDLELGNLRRRLGKQGVELDLDQACFDYLLKHYDPRYGARDIARRLRAHLEPVVARAILSAPASDRFIGFVQNNALVVEGE